MADAFTLLTWIAWAVAASTLVIACVIWRRTSQNGTLRCTSIERPASGTGALVSVLVPARNEAGRVLVEAVGSLLGQDYDPLEVIAVDDRSTDATRDILRALAVRDVRLRVVNGAAPPPGWLGKPHAIQQALAAARGEWLLATDADIVFAPGAVRAAVAYAEANHYDALTLVPHVDCLTFWERVFMPTCWGVMMSTTMPLARANDPRRPEALGIGGFFLIRRHWLERVGGFGAVRAEVLEDVRLAERLKREGARLRVEHAPELIRTRMFTNFRELWEGFTKNLFAGVRFSLAAALAGAASLLLFAVAPTIGAWFCLWMIATGAPGGWLALFVPLGCAYLIQVVMHALINRSWHVPVVYALAAPLSYALFALILLNSAARVATGRGVMWKGRSIYARTSSSPPDGASS